MKRIAFIFSVFIFFAVAVVQRPVLKWSRGGCYSSWCERGWYSSPFAGVVNGTVMLITSAYSVVRLDPNNGTLIWRAMAGHAVSEGTGVDNRGRTWTGIIVADVDGDGNEEIVTGHDGVASVYDLRGEFKPGWPRSPFDEEVRAVAVADLDQNGQQEVILGRAAAVHSDNHWVLDWHGDTRNGWPKPQSDQDGSAAGMYNSNFFIGDLVGDNKLELFVPSDVIAVCAYFENGTALKANKFYGDPPKPWGGAVFYTLISDEKRGWGDCSSSGHATRPNFADGTGTIVDVDNDGTKEVVLVGNFHDCSANPYQDLWIGPMIYTADRMRWTSSKYNWTTIPTNTGSRLAGSSDVIESVEFNVVTVDLDNDGEKEILFPSFDGKIHAFWLDKTEHGSWPFTVGTSSSVKHPTEPVVADLDDDGTPEVLFTSWAKHDSMETGSLYVVSATGVLLFEVPLPLADTSQHWDGAMAAPTLANIDSDSDLEIVIQTALSGVVVFDLPGSSAAKILWQTGRGNFQRTGSATRPPFTPHPGKVKPNVGGIVAGVVIGVAVVAAAAGIAGFMIYRVRHGKSALPSKDTLMFWKKM